VGKKFYDGTEVGRASCEPIIENNTTHYVEDAVPQKAINMACGTRRRGKLTHSKATR
jgi:hypothetical protein